MEDVLLLLINVDQFTNVKTTNSDVEMVHADQMKTYVHNQKQITLITLVQLKDLIDVKSELVLNQLINVLLLKDVTINILKDVQKLVYVKNQKKIVINHT